MQFADIINAKLSQETDRPLMKKELFPVSDGLRSYLRKYDRDIDLPLIYRDLLNYRYANTIRDKDGKPTYWETAVYDPADMVFLKEALVQTYASLKTEGNLSFTKHLEVERIDFCEFGNSIPFRIRVVNTLNNNRDHYYIKAADASRIYGLELEDMLSPNRITFLCYKDTLVEEHIPGIPGDLFLKEYLHHPDTNKIRLAKEFVKFNERCFVRLLGDMRSYNFVVDMTPDIEGYQYRLRAIDFDQQSYEGKKNLYLPQFYKENYEFAELVLKSLSADVIAQYQLEEHTTMMYRVIASRERLMELLNIMIKDELSENYKVKILREELNAHYGTTAFSRCKTMGEVVKRQLKQALQKHLKQVQKSQKYRK